MGKIKKKKINNQFKVFRRTKNSRDEVKTPPDLYKQLNKEFDFDFDPCPFKRPNWDGLECEWGDRNFVNPPFSQIKKWVKKANEEFNKGKLSVILIPLRPHCNYWNEYVYPILTELRFISKFKFVDYKLFCPFPCCLVILDPKKKKIVKSFESDNEIKQIVFSFLQN